VTITHNRHTRTHTPHTQQTHTHTLPETRNNSYQFRAKQIDTSCWPDLNSKSFLLLVFSSHSRLRRGGNTPYRSGTTLAHCVCCHGRSTGLDTVADHRLSTPWNTQHMYTGRTRWKVLRESTNPRESVFVANTWQHLPHVLFCGPLVSNFPTELFCKQSPVYGVFWPLLVGASVII